MFLEISMQMHSVAFVLSRQINKQKYVKQLITWYEKRFA